MSNINCLSESQRKSFINSFDVVLSDCDGVLWKEMEPIRGSPEAVAKLKKLGKKVVYLTNHNSTTREELVEKFKQLSYDAVQDDILSAAYLAAAYLKERNFKKKVFVFGNEGIAKEIQAIGIKTCGTGPDVMLNGDNEANIVSNFKRDPDIGAVVVGLDQHLSFPKFVKAITHARDPKVLLIGTNPDLEKPSPGEAVHPGDGCFIKAVELATGRTAVIVGKPEPFVGEIIRKKYGIDPSRTLMVGDNPKTDILLGKRCGFKTLLVLSGLTSFEKLQSMRNNCADHADGPLPDFYAERLSDIFQY